MTIIKGGPEYRIHKILNEWNNFLEQLDTSQKCFVLRFITSFQMFVLQAFEIFVFL